MKKKVFTSRKIDHDEPKSKTTDVMFKIPASCAILETKMYDKDGKLIEACLVHRKEIEGGSFKVDGISIEKPH